MTFGRVSKYVETLEDHYSTCLAFLEELSSVALYCIQELPKDHHLNEYIIHYEKTTFVECSIKFRWISLLIRNQKVLEWLCLNCFLELEFQIKVPMSVRHQFEQYVSLYVCNERFGMSTIECKHRCTMNMKNSVLCEKDKWSSYVEWRMTSNENIFFRKWRRWTLVLSRFLRSHHDSPTYSKNMFFCNTKIEKAPSLKGKNYLVHSMIATYNKKSFYSLQLIGRVFFKIIGVLLDDCLVYFLDDLVHFSLFLFHQRTVTSIKQTTHNQQIQM